MFFYGQLQATSFKVELQLRTLVHSSLVKMPLNRPHKSLALSKVSLNTLNYITVLTTMFLTKQTFKQPSGVKQNINHLYLTIKINHIALCVN